MVVDKTGPYLGVVNASEDEEKTDTLSFQTTPESFSEAFTTRKYKCFLLGPQTEAICVQYVQLHSPQSSQSRDLPV